jgi:hypothetical protein
MSGVWSFGDGCRLQPVGDLSWVKGVHFLATISARFESRF